VTAYAPNPVVTFGGNIVYSEQTIADISINMGRSDVIEPVQADFARIVLWTPSDTPLDVALSQSVTVDVDKGTTGTARVFTGIISDIDISLAQYGDIGSIAEYSITAVGPLAQLNKALAGGAGYPKQFDGDRIYSILTEAFLKQWDDLAPTLTWNALPNGVQWDQFDGVNQVIVDNLATSIDRPGVYELTAYSDGFTNALTLCQDAAQSARGVFHGSGDGVLHYHDYASRVTSPVITLTADDLLTDGLQTAAQWSEIVNDVIITYKNNQEKQARDETSILSYGQLSGTRSTQLENGVDAQAQADDFLASRAYPRVYPESFTVALHNPSVSDATRDALLIAENGTAIVTDELPAVFGTSFKGYLEGYNWRLTRYEAYIDLICSAQSETYSSVIWQQIPPDLTWAAYNPSTRWSDL
jgi:hypothetical protein